MATIQEGCTKVVLGGTVSVAVAPVVGIATRQGIAHPQGSVGADGVGFACCSFQIEQVLGTAVGVGHIGRLAHGIASVHVHVADIRCRAVFVVNNHVVSTTHQHLGLAVTVPVVAHGIVLLVGT